MKVLALAVSKELIANKTCVIKISGKFNYYNIKDTDFIDQIDSESKNMIFDLTDAVQVDSTGFSVIASTYKRLCNEGYTLYVAGMRDHPKEIFRILGLGRVISVFDNMSDAIDFCVEKKFVTPRVTRDHIAFKQAVQRSRSVKKAGFLKDLSDNFIAKAGIFLRAGHNKSLEKRQ
jgi:anti-anti-sigma factor